VSWQAVAYPVEVGNYQLALAEDLRLYALSSVELGGNFRLIECNLNVSPPSCTARDTGIAVPSTDGHFNPRSLLIEGDHVYTCYTRWTGLTCYRFSRITGTGASYGSVNPAGHSDLNYHHMVKIKEDMYYMIARTGTGRQWTLFRFKGSPSQITDSAQWERIGNIFDDGPIATPSTCAEGSISFSYCTFGFFVNERYVMFSCYNRCPSDSAEIGNYSIYFFDVLRERLLAPDLTTEVPFGSHTLDTRTKITVIGKPAAAQRTEIRTTVYDLTRRKAYGRAFFAVPGGYEVGILNIDLSTRTARYIRRYSGTAPPLSNPVALAQDGKVVIVENDYIRLYDPATDSISDIQNVPGLRPVWDWAQICFQTEDTYKPIDTIITTGTHLVLPPNVADGLRVPKRITVSSPGAGQLRVQAQFQLAPAQVRVRLWRIPDLTIVNEETLAGATSIDRTYSVAAGRYRAEVTAL
jgi:hypothetical protein